MSRNSIKFAVTNASHCATTWKCWANTSKRDVYLACTQLEGKIKLSMHASGQWHVAFDAIQMQNIFEETKYPSSRFLGKWSKPEPLGAGLTLACRVHTPWYAVTMPISTLQDSVLRIPAPPKDQLVEVVIFIADKGAQSSGWPCSKSMDTKLVGSFDIGEGEKVWIIYQMIPLVEPIIPSFAKPIYFKDKDENDLLEPGLGGVTWGRENNGSIVFFEAPVTATKQA